MDVAGDFAGGALGISLFIVPGLALSEIDRFVAPGPALEVKVFIGGFEAPGVALVGCFFAAFRAFARSTEPPFNKLATSPKRFVIVGGAGLTKSEHAGAVIDGAKGRGESVNASCLGFGLGETGLATGLASPEAGSASPEPSGDFWGVSSATLDASVVESVIESTVWAREKSAGAVAILKLGT